MLVWYHPSVFLWCQPYAPFLTAVEDREGVLFPLPTAGRDKAGEFYGVEGRHLLLAWNIFPFFLACVYLVGFCLLYMGFIFKLR